MSQRQYQAYSPEEIRARRRYIHQEMLSVIEPNFTSLKTSIIQKLFDLYDEVFFGGQIGKKLKAEKTSLKMSVTQRKGIKYGGMCIKTTRGKQCFYTLHFPVTVFAGLFTKGEKALKGGGLLCRDRLDCLQLTFEHELTHLLMFLWSFQSKIRKGRGKMIYSGHGKLFQCMLYAYFGQTEFRHSLFAGDVEKHLKLSEVFVGMKVRVKGKRGGLGVIKGFLPNKAKVEYLTRGKLVTSSVSFAFLEKTEEKFELPTHLEKSEARIGMKVKFSTKEKEIIGTITKINPARAVVVERVGGRTRSWGVRWVLLQKA